jgi:predicted ATPase
LLSCGSITFYTLARMITRLEIDGFKTFRNFELEFAPLTVVAGTNASGKSNLFDALHLLSRLAETDIRTAFTEQRGEARELFTQFQGGRTANEMSFSVEMLVDRKVRDNWGGEAILKYTRLKYIVKLIRTTDERGLDHISVLEERLENLKHQDDEWVKTHLPARQLEYWRPKVTAGRRTKPYIYTEDTDNGVATIKLPQDGRAGGKETPANVVSQTVLSGVNSVDFPHVFAAKQEMLQWRFLQLSPEALRIPSPYLAPNQIGENGANLAAALHRIQQMDENSYRYISRELNRLLPHLTEVSVFDDKAGQQFVTIVKGNDGRLFSSRVLSEGTLRLLTLCTLLHDPMHKGLICFEEPENGVHPSRLKEMVALLRGLSIDFNEKEDELRQMIVNTHSPVLLGEMIRFHDDQNVIVWFSKLVSRLDTYGNSVSKERIHVTRMIRVHTDAQLSMLPPENRVALQEAKKYLEVLPGSIELLSTYE